MFSIAQAAEKLQVNKKTLIRWDALGKLPAQRDSSGNRIYDEQDILKHAQWFILWRKHKTHNRQLTNIRKECDKYLATQPLGPMENPKFHKFEDMEKVYTAMHKWEAEDMAILEEYTKLPSGFKPKFNPYS